MRNRHFHEIYCFFISVWDSYNRSYFILLKYIFMELYLMTLYFMTLYSKYFSTGSCTVFVRDHIKDCYSWGAGPTI